MHFTPIILFSFTLGLLTSCYVETARPEERKELVIASDYLTQADTALFSQFIAQSKARLIIREINTDQLIGLIRNADHNSGLDILMLSSIHNVLRVHKQNILQPLSSCAESLKFDTSYISYKYNYVGFGIDPFIVRYNSDTISSIDDYADLTELAHINNLDFPSMVTFLSPLRKEMSKVDTYEWAKQWNNHTIHIDDYSNDSLLLCLGTYSSLYDVSKDTILNSLNQISYPKWKSNGTFYNLRTMAIVKQAENFTVAKEFISFYRNPGYNGQLTEKLHLFRINMSLDNKQSFTPNTYTNQDLIQYHTGIERINTNINK
ncbi:MAG: hypothetical protein MK066_04310 [Crocinitomicaceae bacterium]|nr:hypothetical protein [Crocinitomicaceae bacterium]